MSLPKQFGRYQVVDVLGQGAMGLVYKAVDPVIERGVAIKVIQANPGLGEADLARMQARFEQEFRSAGALSHANIVTIFDVGKEGDLYYIAMEYVEGLSLDTVLGQKGVLSFKEVSDLAWELSSGLDYAHAQGVVHRDIKPANVLITSEGRFKITDFGLAKLEATTLTRTGALVGTPAYMSPEQVGGQAITGKTDQFSLGILLYQALTGERPFTGDSASTIMYKIMHEEPLPPGQVNRSLPEAADGVLLRALEKNVDRRYGSCAELADGLRRALGTSPSATLTAPGPMSAPGGVATVVASPPDVNPVTRTSHQPASQPQAPMAAAPPSGMAAGSVPSPGAPPQSYAPVPPTPAMPRWLLTLGILLPSVVLLALVAWFISQGVFVPGSPSGKETLAAGAPIAGAEIGDGDSNIGGDSESDSGSEQAAAPVAATPEDLEAVRDELSTEMQRLRDEVETNQQASRETVSNDPVRPAAPPARPERIFYSISSDPEGALIVVDGRRSGITTPADIELATDVDHQIEIMARGYEPYLYEVRMAGVAAENLPPGLHVALSRTAEVAAANPSDTSRGRGSNRGARSESLDDVPEELRRLMDASDVPTGRIVIEAPYAVSVRVRSGQRQANMAPAVRRRFQSLPDAVRRRIMGGFVLNAKNSHDIELPAGTWLITLMAPQVMYLHEEQVVLRGDQRLSLSEHIPTEFFNVSITSDPPGARVRVDGLPNMFTTPHNGPIVPGSHRFQFFWGGATRTSEADIDRDGMTIVGRRQQ